MSDSGLKYGLAISPAGPWGQPGRIAELAALAEASGWDGVFCEDYLIFWGGHECHDVWQTLALVAQATTRVTLGTMVTPIPYRRAATVAGQATTLDHLSGGRAILGVGIGADDDADAELVDPKPTARERAASLDRGLDQIDRLWSAGLDGPALRPPPVQRPRIPIWVGGAITRRGPRARALRWDGSCLYRVPPGEGWQDVTPADVEALRADAEALGKPDFTIAVGGRQRSDDRAADLRYVADVAAAGANWWTEYAVPSLPYEEARRRIAGGPLRP